MRSKLGTNQLSWVRFVEEHGFFLGDFWDMVEEQD